MTYQYKIHRLTNESSHHTSLENKRTIELNNLGKDEWEVKSSYQDGGNTYVILGKIQLTKE